MTIPAQLKPKVSRSAPKQKTADDSLLDSLVSGGSSALQVIGDTTNKLSRATWGSANYLAGGESGGGLLNLVPFSDTMGLTNPRKGVELSEFTENLGLLPKNQAGFDRWDIPRFALDVAGDPLSYVGGIGLLKSVGRGGSVLAKASKDISKLSRVGRMTTTVGEAASKVAPDALGAAVKRSGFADVSDFIAKHGSEPVGGLASLTRGPLGRPIKALGTGKLAQKIGGGLDKLGEAARYGKIPGTTVSPGAQVSRLFSPKAMGLHTPEVQQATKGLSGKREAIEATVKKGSAKDAINLMKQGALDDESSTLGRMYGEGVLDMNKLPEAARLKAQAVAKVIEPYTQRFPELLRESRKLGIRVEKHGDPAGIEYMPRQFVDMIQNRANTMSREDYLIGIKQGSEELRQIISDPKVLEGSFADAEAYILGKYGDGIVSVMPKAETKAGLTQIDPEKWRQAVADRDNNIKQLVHRVRNVYTPEQRKVGGFGRNVILDAQDATIGMEWKLARAGSMLETLKTMAKPIDQLDIPGDTRSVTEILDAAGLDPRAKIDEASDVADGGALRSLAEAMDLAPSPENLDAIAKMHVPAAQADDLVRLMKGDDIKATVGPAMQLVDSFTNAFKVGVLSWPARHVRDLTSGQVMNALTGNWSPEAFTKAQSLIAGGMVDFTDIPIVQRMLAEQGLEATAENSSDIMRQLIYAHDVFTGMHGPRGAGEVVGGGALPGLSADFQREFVGKDPLSPFKPQTLLGGTSWNPLKLRGVGGQLRTENRIAATSERAGKLTDGMNRIVPFIHNLKRGMAPERAKEVIDALQVNYAPSAFSAAERKYLKRAFPFYSFQSRVMKTVLGELLDRPGGGIAQAIRGTNELSSSEGGPVPETVSSGLSIPLGETSDGSQRYLTGAGLMHEAAGSPFIFKNGQPDLTGTMSEFGAQLHPLAKLGVETATGRSLFQRRDLDELDPALGRTLSNLGLRDELPSGKARPVINSNFENMLASSPAARLLSTARTLTDPRKLEGGPFPGSIGLMNLTSGLRFTDVSPAVREGILRKAISELSSERGATKFETVRFSKSQIADAEKSDPELAAEMAALNNAATDLVNRSKARSKSRKAKIKPPAR